MNTKKKITRKELKQLSEIFNYFLVDMEKQQEKIKIPFILSYGLTINQTRIEEEIKAIDNSSKCLNNEELKQKEQEVINEYCIKEKDENGNSTDKPLVSNNQYQFYNKDIETINNKLKLVKDQFQDVLEFEKFLDEEIEIDFYQFKINDEIAKLEISPSIVKLITKYLICE